MNTFLAILIISLCATLTGICGWLAVVFLSAMSQRIKHPAVVVLKKEVAHVKNDTALMYEDMGFFWGCASFLLYSFVAVTYLIEEFLSARESKALVS